MTTPHTGRPLASLSLDADNLWSYMKTHGDQGWESRPTYLPMFLPLVLDSLDRLGRRITFFVVGIDAARDENRAALRSIVERGHEVGNHSYEHEPWLHLYAPEKIAAEIASAERAIADATGERPIGFRGPGFSWSPDLLEVLRERGYLYDASTLPTYLGPLARAYYFRTAKLSAEQRADRAALFGTFRDGLRPVRPYQWELANGRSLLEIPVTTIPGIKTPFHLSYLLWLSRYSEALAMTYLRTALLACRATGTEPSFLLHPLDLIGGDQEPRLAFFPGMDVPGSVKMRFFERVIRTIGAHFDIVPMSVHARAILERGRLAARVPELATSSVTLAAGRQ